MGRKPRAKTIKSTNQSNELSTIIEIIVLFFIGMTVATEIYQIKDDVQSTFLLLGILFFINVWLFRIMDLHLAFKRSHRVQYWKFKQKIIFGLYLFLTLSMIGATFPYGEVLNLLFFLVLIYLGINFVWQSFKNFSFVLPHRQKTILTTIRNFAIEEIDQMEGKEFEAFLSKLYDGMGYYVELTPHNDYGIDVLTIKDKIKTGIQAKCYGEGRTIGVEAVNEVCGGAGVWKVQKKMVITNRYFSKEALISAKSNNIEMIDRDGLQLLIKEYETAMEKRTPFSFLTKFNRSKV
ncbi:restriction endonuclease [uncultured Psychrobacillus sp.]|uniref:restriction endonuclease n=1 Tax=uncultured Psychrobacillus sp. TaxID=1551585 RepID=UPI002627725A|nr:restriction endonuclease [uncultured Psychrobacillus sp.]